MSNEQFVRRAWALVLVVSAAVVVVDQSTKSWAQSNLRDDVIEIFGSVRLALTYNRGVAFGLGEGAAPLLVAVALGAMVIVLFGRRINLTGMSIAGVGLVFGGALGNVCDRVFRNTGGGVVDFIDVGFWPVFNLADTAIVVGAFALVLWGSRRPVVQ